MRLRHLSKKTAFLLLGFLVLGACGKDDPEPPVPGSGEGLLRVSVRHTGDTPLAVFAYKADGSSVAGKEEPAGTPSTWSWSERLVVGEYALLVAGANPAEVRLRRIWGKPMPPPFPREATACWYRWIALFTWRA